MLKGAQQAIEEAMLGLSLKVKLRLIPQSVLHREAIVCQTTTIIDIARRISKLMSQWAGHIYVTERWWLSNICGLHSKDRLRVETASLGKCSVGRVLVRWTDDLKKLASLDWMHKAADQM